MKIYSKGARLLGLARSVPLANDPGVMPHDDPNAAFEQCLGWLRQGDPRASGLLRGLLDRFPDHAAGWETLGFHLLQAGKGEAALLCLRRAMAVAPSARLAMGCGDALKSLRRLIEARAAFASACRLDPALTRAAFQLGLCAQDGGDLEGARAAYERVIALEPAVAEAWVNLGTVLQEMGDLAGARRAYAGAVTRRGVTFGRVSQALAAAPKGELWLDLGRLRRSLAG